MQQPFTFKNTERGSVSKARLPGRLWLPNAVLGFCLVVISFGTALGAPLPSLPLSSLSLSMHNQQFSAHIIRAPLEKVLANLTFYVPIRFIIKGNVQDELISASFSNLSLGKTIEHLLLGYDYAILQPHRDSKRANESHRPMEVVILSRNPGEPSSDSNRPSFIPSRKTSTQPTLLQANQDQKIQEGDKLSVLLTGQEARDSQQILEDTIKDADSEVRTLLQELVQELDQLGES